ncbi:MAG: hypothetical protein CMK09_10060 [Ponticaulis sp.]|nr:hypothetical protein [Ponticaulis sp.]
MTKIHISDTPSTTGPGTTDNLPVGSVTRGRFPHKSARLTGKSGMLFKVELALSRMENGDYGYCVTCRGEIKIEELEADPSIIVCHECRHSDH